MPEASTLAKMSPQLLKVMERARTLRSGLRRSLRPWYGNYPQIGADNGRYEKSFPN